MAIGWARRAGAESPWKSLDSGLAPQLLTSCGMISGAGYSAPANAASAVGVSPAPVSRYGSDLDEVLIAVSGSTGGSEAFQKIRISPETVSEWEGSASHDSSRASKPIFVIGLRRANVDSVQERLAAVKDLNLLETLYV
jgi:hypothetical protein